MSQASAVILAVVAAVYSTSALAERVTPPKRFDYPARDALIVERSPEQIQELCQKHSPWREGVGACVLPGRPCIILWPRGALRDGLLWRHEQAHCNGWPGDHPR